MPKIVDHDRQREMLLDACFRVFVEEGYADATMRKLASAAGVSTGMLYHYFPDKLSLLASLFELMLTRHEQNVRGDLPARATVPIRLRAMFAFVRRNEIYLRDLVRLALEVQRHEPSAGSRERVKEVVVHYRAVIADILGVETQMADMVFGFFLGGLTLGMLDPDAVDLDAQEALAQAVWEKLGPKLIG